MVQELPVVQGLLVMSAINSTLASHADGRLMMVVAASCPRPPILVRVLLELSKCIVGQTALYS